MKTTTTNQPIIPVDFVNNTLSEWLIEALINYLGENNAPEEIIRLAQAYSFCHLYSRQFQAADPLSEAVKQDAPTWIEQSLSDLEAVGYPL